MESQSKTKIIIICVVLFILFVVWRFPYRNLKGLIFGRIHANTGIQLMAEDISPSFFGWPGLQLTNVDLVLPVGREDAIYLWAKKVVFRVGLGSFMPPAPSFSLNLKSLKKGGDLYLWFFSAGKGGAAQIEADNVELEQIRYSGLSGSLGGILSADGNITFDTTDLSKISGDLELNITNLKLPVFNIYMSPNYSFPIPPIKMGGLKSKISIRSGVVNLSDFKFGNPDSDLQGVLSGEIKLGKTWMASSVKLGLKLKLSEKYKQNSQAAALVSTLSSFYSEKTGEYGMRCHATIDDIMTKFVCAIPEKWEN